IHWDNFLILIGDTMLGVGCKMPYSGWIEFKGRIVKAIKLLLDTKIIQAIERYSIRYSDIIEGEKLNERIQMINMDIRVGSHIVKEEIFTVRVEIPHGSFLNVIQIAAEAAAPLPDGNEKSGTLVDTDTLCNYQTNDLKKFVDELPARLDEIHDENKEMFF